MEEIRGTGTGSGTGREKVSRGRKKRRIGIFDILIGLVFLAGVCIMAYPTVSDWINRWLSGRAVSGYSDTVGGLPEEQIAEAFRVAREYNRRLKENPNPYSEKNRTPGYEETLNVDGSGIMGYVQIDKIKVRLPFYHGTEEEVLQTAIGHLEGSCVPVGDEGDHVVVSAHRGLPSAKLFSDLPELEVGDTFTVTVLNMQMVYEIDQILTVLPDSVEAFEALRCEKGKDLVTLITCTPYGVNTHRLLVRGHRIS